MHVSEDHFYPEIVDPFTGEVLPELERSVGKIKRIVGLRDAS